MKIKLILELKNYKIELEEGEARELLNVLKNLVGDTHYFPYPWYPYWSTHTEIGDNVTTYTISNSSGISAE
jgi:hypothetical protein